MAARRCSRRRGGPPSCSSLWEDGSRLGLRWCLPVPDPWLVPDVEAEPHHRLLVLRAQLVVVPGPHPEEGLGPSRVVLGVHGYEGDVWGAAVVSPSRLVLLPCHALVTDAAHCHAFSSPNFTRRY